MTKFPLATALAAAITALCATSAHAQATPVVQGPESVADWYNAGNAFMAQNKALFNNTRRAKNVILFVGDGMGVSTVTAARILEGQMKAKTGEENRLSFDNFPFTALSKTYSWDQQTSDSAPTMTAMSTGYKAREGQLSVNHTTPRGECNAAVIDSKKLKTILEYAADMGKSTGIVSTARITHATPAALYSHTSVRDWEADSNLPTTDVNTGAPCRGSASAVKDIARQLIEVSPTLRSSLKVALGGGRTYFLPNTSFDPEYGSTKGRRIDGRNLTNEWISTRNTLGGSAYVWNKSQFDAFDPVNNSYLLGLFEPSHVQYEADKAIDGAGEPTLTEMTDKALRMVMKDPNGFFLHVEGGRIDHAHHAGNAKRALGETIEFSKAIQQTVDMLKAAGKLDDTLIIVTADHSHTFTIAGYPSRGNNILGLVREVPAKDGNALGNSLDSNGLPYTTLAYANGPGYRVGGRPNLTNVDTTDLEFLQEASVPLASETHAGEDVAVYATGPKAYLVRGTMEQNWIFHVMREAFGF
ncbi:MAG: alkaline phosphatase [Pseudomonadota bacterium]